MIPNEVSFRYEGKTPDGHADTCVYTYAGKEYRIPYTLVVQWASARANMPRKVRQELDFWVEMIINPD